MAVDVVLFVAVDVLFVARRVVVVFVAMDVFVTRSGMAIVSSDVIWCKERGKGCGC